ncbi:MAG: FAD binding domain-containing protein [Sphaerochaetaceae bacterium]|jgi:CO/xanthine dehydrogenase FAD-binding subunit|nr:FAD binding domain-containing protein [Sphaerochaetaceae bacterium]MDX9939140.1 FAD binding domain-containing protein [Sphaerochaetaceae bacterium]
MAIQRFMQVGSLDDALQELSVHKEQALLIAGGTDVMPALRSGLYAQKQMVIDLSPLAGKLGNIRHEEDMLHIGPLVTHSRIMEDPVIREFLPILAQASAHVGSPQIRNRGTIGGNIITLAACADTVVPLLALDAQLVFARVGGVRCVPMASYLDEGETRFDASNEILTDIMIPLPNSNRQGMFLKIARRQAAAKSRMSVAVLTTIAGHRITDARVVVGALMPWPRRVGEAERYMMGKAIGEVDPMKVGALAAELAITVTGQRRSFAYKIPVVQELMRRAVTRVLGTQGEA